MYASRSQSLQETNADLDLALTRAIDFAANYKKGKSKKETKTEKHQREQLESLEKQLAKSKKQVIKHVIQSRKIEHALKQTSLATNAVTKHVQILPDISRKAKKKRIIKTQWLSESELHVLDVAGKLVAGTSSVLQRSLNMYNDTYLTKELNAFPESQLHEMNMLLFSKVGWISSGKRMSLTEGQRLFDDASAATTILLRHRPDQQYDNVRWWVLKRMLRSLLRLRHLAESFLSYETELRVRASAGQSSKRRAAKPESSTASPGKMLSRTQVIDNRFRGDSLDTPLAKTLPNLSKQLQASKKRQEELDRKIQSNISKVSRSVPIGAMKSAHSFARNSGAGKMINVFHAKILSFYRIVFDRLKNNVTMYRAEEQSAIFQRLFGTWKLCRIFDVALQSKIHRHFRDWVEKVENMKANEEWAAAVEIQRLGRDRKSVV